MTVRRRDRGDRHGGGGSVGGSPDGKAPSPPPQGATGDSSERRITVRSFCGRWLRPHWPLLVSSVAFSLVAAVAASSYGVLMKIGGQWLREADPRILWMPIAAVIAAAIRGGGTYGHAVCSNIAIERGLYDLQALLFRRLNGGDYALVRQESSATSLSRFINDINVLRETSVQVASDLPRAVLTTLGCIGVMVWMDWALTVFLLVLYPLLILPAIILGARVRKTSAVAQERTGAVAGLLAESFREARLIRAFNLDEYQQRRVQKGLRARMELVLKVLRQRNRIKVLMEIAGGLAFGSTVMFVGWRVLRGESTVEVFLGFIVVLSVASPEIRLLGTMSSIVNEGLAAADRVEGILSTKPGVCDGGVIGAQQFKGGLRICDARFAYGDLPVLDGLSLDVEPGQTVALVGPSGAGKSTLFDILLRLYDLDSGLVQFDGIDIRDLPLERLRRNIALVSQDASLFDDSIAANIALGHPEASRSEIEAAAEAAACDFTLSMADGLDSRVGEGGGLLSGGQRQRVAIARALLRDAPILLLDEATSALDAENEARVHEALDRLREGRTTLVIAHRLSTVRSADRIAVMSAGRVVELGKHEALIEKSGVYADLARYQIR